MHEKGEGARKEGAWCDASQQSTCCGVLWRHAAWCVDRMLMAEQDAGYWTLRLDGRNKTLCRYCYTWTLHRGECSTQCPAPPRIAEHFPPVTGTRGFKLLAALPKKRLASRVKASTTQAEKEELLRQAHVVGVADFAVTAKGPHLLKGSVSIRSLHWRDGRMRWGRVWDPLTEEEFRIGQSSECVTLGEHVPHSPLFAFAKDALRSLEPQCPRLTCAPPERTRSEERMFH